MALFTIDLEKCKKDGLCAAVCPRGIISIEVDTSFPQPTEDAEELCINCGHCSAICPHQALSLTNLDPSSWPKNTPANLPSRQQLTQLIRGRRSTRAYKKEPVNRDSLSALISLARYAPTARNSQQLQWLVIDDKKILANLLNHVIDWMKDSLDKKEPAAIAYGFDQVVSAYAEGNDPILRGAPGLVIIHAPSTYPMGMIDSTIAMTTFELAASAENIGTCWAGFLMIATKQWQPLREALDIPEGNVLTTAIMVGYPKFRYSRLPERNFIEIQWR